MDSHLPPAIKSFIIRFVVEDSPQASIDQPKYRGAIRHIQTDEELNFSNWQEAVEFIQRFVQLEPCPDKKSQTP
jgi:hypothetical protein